MNGQLVVDPVLRQRYRFERATGEAGRAILRIETWLDPGGGVTPHAHPSMEERFHVISGTPQFLAGRRWSTAAPGETVVVPAGARHAYRNRSDGEVHLVCEAAPPQSLEEFLTEVAEMNRAGLFTPQGVPKGPRALLAGVALAHRHREMVELHFPPLPPPLLQRLLFPPLARLAARRGYGPATPAGAATR